MSLDVLFEILWSLECFATKVTLMWLEWNMDANVRGDVVSLDGSGTASTPLACEVEIVGAFASDVSFTYVVL
jgi:hypothetical protein